MMGSERIMEMKHYRERKEVKAVQHMTQFFCHSIHLPLQELHSSFCIYFIRMESERRKIFYYLKSFYKTTFIAET